MAKGKSPPGAPAWMVTFADLMSLLVCFFVLIISFSIQDEQKLQVVAGSVRDAFGVRRDWQARALVEIDGRPNARKLKLPPNHNIVVYMPRPDRPPPEDVKEDDAADDPQLQGGERAQKQVADEKLLASAADFLEDSDFQGQAVHAHVGDPGAEGGTGDPGAIGHAEDWREQFRQQKIEAAENRLIQDLQDKAAALAESRPELARLANNMTAERVDEGVRIEFIDDLEQPMFRLGSAELDPSVKPLLNDVAALIAGTNNRLLISGHTDGRPYHGRVGYDNWNLSSDRANATRQALLEAGVPAAQIAAVIGKGDSEHAIPSSPDDPRNRRIGILLLRESE